MATKVFEQDLSFGQVKGFWRNWVAFTLYLNETLRLFNFNALIVKWPSNFNLYLLGSTVTIIFQIDLSFAAAHKN